MAVYNLTSANDNLRLILSANQGSADDTIYGNAGNDILDGGRGLNLIYGGAGDDRIYLGYGQDRGFGDDGNDTLFVVSGASVEAHGGSGMDVLAADQRLDLTKQTYSSIEVLKQWYGTIDAQTAGQANFRMTLQQVDDFGTYQNSLVGSLRISIEFANSGLIDFSGRVASNTALKLFLSSSGTNQVVASQGNDWILGGSFADTVHGGAGDDEIFGGSGLDYLYGDDGNDRLFANDTANVSDQLFGGLGNDTLYVDNRDRVFDTGGYDRIVSSTDYINLPSYIEVLILSDAPQAAKPFEGRGNDLNNLVQGNSANNKISGFGGNDTMIGLGGIDDIYGGAGNDTFKFLDKLLATDKDNVLDRLMDYERGEKLDLRAMDAISSTASDDAFRFDTDMIPAAGELTIKNFSGGYLGVCLNTDNDADYEGIILIFSNGQLQPEDFQQDWFLL